MTQIEFLKGMKMITTFYNKDFTQEQLNEWFMFFEDVEAENFYRAIRKRAKESKYVPTINELLENIRITKNDDYLAIVKLMEEDGYFHSSKELEKTLHFIDENIIPSWLLEDMEKYRPKLKLGTSTRLAIGTEN